MRIGITYLYTIFRCGYPHTVKDALKSIPEMRKLGFRFLEMEGLGASNIRSMHKSLPALLRAVTDSGVHVHNFCVVDPDLVSLNPARQAAALDRFKMGVEIAEALECETLHLASYAPPVEYARGRPYALGAKGGYQIRDRFEIRIPKAFSWEKVWNALVRSCRACADLAADAGRTVIMEPRVGEVICSVDSLLRLIEHVNRPNFKANFDTGHFSAQRENVVLALSKLKNHFANIHISDNVPTSVDHLPIGDGAIDWKEFFRNLKIMNYRGYLGLDLGMTPHLVRDYRKSVDRIRSIASDLEIELEL
jgi:sugar phosphate isomerase/epimerase